MTFKFTFKGEYAIEDEHKSPELGNKHWDKVKLCYPAKLDNFYQHSTIFDVINLIGQNEDLMSVVYRLDEEQKKKNWVEEIFAESLASDCELGKRQRFFQLLSEPLSQFLTSKPREEVLRELI